MQRPGPAAPTAAAPWASVRQQLGRGRQQLRVRQRDLTDRVIAADPGLTHLRLGIRVVTCIATVLLVQYGIARLLDRPPVVALLLGAVVAMLLSSGVRENTRRRTLLVALPGLPAALLGACAALLLQPWHTLTLVVFVLISFGAVWVRRFGGAFVSYGMLCWQSYFFLLFLAPPRSELPAVLLIVTVSVAWVTLLLTTVLYEDPAVRLRRTVDAFRARCRAAIAALLGLLDGGAADPVEPATVPRALRSQLVQLGEIALLIDGQLSEARALPEGVTPTRVRQWVVDMEIAVDDLVRGTTAPAVAALPPDDRALLRRALERLGWGDHEEAGPALAPLTDPAAAAPLQRIGRAATRLLALARDWSTGAVLQPGTDDPDGSAADADDTAGWTSVVTLRAGRLPGTAPLAEQALARHLAEHADRPRTLPRRIADRLLALPLTTRQAIQAAVAAGLAIIAGHLISEQRWYWAVIAAFISFTNAATASETLRRSIARILGTTGGLVVAVGLANVTAGHTPAAFAVLLLALALAWYLFPVSYGGMVLCLTIALGQLYGLLRTFSDGVLVLRLEETVVGAVIGAVVGLLVLPTSTLETVRTARAALLDAAAEVLDRAAVAVREHRPDGELLALVVKLDDAARQLTTLTDLLVHARFSGSRRAGLRHRVAVLGSIAATCRTIAVTSMAEVPAADLHAEVAELLAAECRRLAAAPHLITADHGTSELSDRIGDLLAGAPPGPTGAPPRLALQLGRLADALALLVPRGRS